MRNAILWFALMVIAAAFGYVVGHHRGHEEGQAQPAIIRFKVGGGEPRRRLEKGGMK